MIKNNIKIAWRSLLKNRSYSVINITGLAVGLAAVLLISLWIQNQIKYDNFYPDKDQIYKVWHRTVYQGDINVHDISQGPVTVALKQKYPEVEYASRMYWSVDRLFTYGDKSLKSEGNEVDSDFLQIFNFPLIHGSQSTALESPNNIVLTESLSKRLFGDMNPLGEQVRLDNEELYNVTGVIEDLPGYTDFDFNYLIPLTEATAELYGSANTYFSFVKLKKSASVDDFNKKIEPLVRSINPEQKWGAIFLYPMSKMHLYNHFENGVPVGGLIDQVRLVAGIGLLILFIACINFVNLATARSQKRGKEVGVRKVVGASKKSLMLQFLVESVLVAFVSGAIAVGLLVLSIPVFNGTLDKPLVMDLSDLLVWGVAVAFISISGLLAGIYPAFVLSAFKPIKTLKGIVSNHKRPFNLREGLVVLQFGIAIVLIIATLVIRLQINYAGQRDVGYNVSQLIEIPSEGDMDKSYEAFRAELINSGAAISVTRTGWSTTIDGSTTAGVSWEGATPQQVENSSFVLTRTESDFVETLGLTLVDGRDLDYARLPADSAAVLLNETAIKRMGIENPVGKYVEWGSDTYTIAGVVSDFISGSPYAEVRPMLVYASKNYLLNIIVRSNPQRSMQQNLQDIERITKKFNPAYPFSYNFVDQRFSEKFREQEQIGNLALVFHC